jgi:hypothetical protein
LRATADVLVRSMSQAAAQRRGVFERSGFACAAGADAYHTQGIFLSDAERSPSPVSDIGQNPETGRRNKMRLKSK